MPQRADIQALGALAVALVVVYHLWPSVLRGGYVGVDVFFVISGFLITGHLVREAEATGTVALRAFWGRRIRRLLPGASVVLVAVFVGMLVLMPSSLWHQTMREIVASALYAQNWMLAGASIDYLGAESGASAVQHFWSLSVEEQFYLAWPLIIVALVLMARTRPVRRKVALVLGIIAALSLAYSIADVAMRPPFAYFDTGARAWEFAAGGLLALAVSERRMSPGRLARVPLGRMGRMPQMRLAAQVTGGALILACAITLGTGVAFPGAVALLPVAGAVLALWGGDRQSVSRPVVNRFVYRIADRIVDRIVESRPVQFVGDHSYGLYLWHWPFIVFAPYLLGQSAGAWESVFIIAASVIAAWLSKRYVEDPVRRRSAGGQRTRVTYVFAAVSIGAILAATGAASLVLSRTVAASAAEATEKSRIDPCFGAAALAAGLDCSLPFAVPSSLDPAFVAADHGSLDRHCSAAHTEIVTCEFGASVHPVHTAAVIGNSHAGHLMAGLDAYGKANGWRFLLIRKTDCLGVLTVPVTKGYNAECLQRSRNVQRDLLARADIDVVVFATHSNAIHYIVPPKPTAAVKLRVLAGVGATFRALQAAGKTVVAVGEVPAPGESVPECVWMHRGRYDPCAAPNVDQGENTNIEMQAARTNGVATVDLTHYLCTPQLCHVVVGGALAYFDANHLTATFSRSIGPYLGANIAAVLP